MTVLKFCAAPPPLAICEWRGRHVGAHRGPPARALRWRLRAVFARREQPTRRAHVMLRAAT